jgi:hypothetical protein
MLYKNDAPYKLAENDKKTITNRFKKFPLTIIYPPGMVIKSRSPQNLKPDKPNSISFPLTATVKSIDGTDQWRYAENVIIKEHGIKKYTPKNLRFNGRLALTDKDIELIWFLFTKSEYCKGGTNQSKTPKFMFEDLITEAEIRAEKESIKSEVNALIYGKESGLSEDQLRKIAKAYFIKNTDDLSFAQVKLAIEHQISRDPKNGYQVFLNMANTDDLISVKSKIQKVIDSGLLKYNLAKKEWQWKDDTKIFKVDPTMNPNDAIYDYYMGNKDFQETLESVEKSKKQKIAKSVEA